MLLVRRFEEKSAEMQALAKIADFLHLCIGEETITVGAIDGVTGAKFLTKLKRPLKDPHELASSTAAG